jgi:hypothetical protein
MLIALIANDDIGQKKSNKLIQRNRRKLKDGKIVL